MGTMKLRALTFDFWNTLVVDGGADLNGLRRQAVLSSLEEAGLRFDDEALDGRLAAAGALHDDAWRRGRAFEPREAAEHLVSSLGQAADPHRARIVSAYLDAGAEARLDLAPGAAEVVAALAKAEVKLAIVCDVGLTGSRHLRGFLERAGLLRYFDGWGFSDEVGAFKPAAAIFEHALAALGVTASTEVAHVGDLRRTDIRGAGAIGLRTIRYRGIFDDPGPGPDGELVIDDLRDLISIATGETTALGRA
jgi:FMN phosphatase YigB (HAD superfamily)